MNGDRSRKEMTFLSLPSELIKLTCSYLDNQDVLACAATSRQLREGSGVTILKKGISERLTKPIPFRFGTFIIYSPSLPQLQLLH